MGAKASRLAKKVGRKKKDDTCGGESAASSVPDPSPLAAPIQKREVNLLLEEVSLLCDYWLRMIQEEEHMMDDIDWFIPTDLIRLLWTFVYINTRCPEDFELLCVIGRGSFAKVMAVKDKLAKSEEDRQRIYAMKILKKKTMRAKDQTEHTQGELELYRRIHETCDSKDEQNIKTKSSMKSTSESVLKKDCPFLLRLHWAFETPAKVYFVLDYLNGGELFYHLKTHRRLTEVETMGICAQVTLALECLHSRFNVVYRGLKPEDVYLDRKGHITLGDFGLVGFITPEKSRLNSFVGTPEYLAPEIVKNLPYSFPIDWWALGTLLYELTVGIPPFYSQNIAEMYRKIQDAPLLFPPSLTSEIKVLITGLLQRDPEMRMGTVSGATEVCSAEWWFNTGGEGYETAEQMWLAVSELTFDPAFKPRTPQSSADEEFKFVDTMFTSEKVVDSFVISELPDEKHEFVFPK